MADQLILAFDTSAAHCAAALLLGDTILVSRVEEMSKGQAERLMPLLEEVLAEARKSWSDLHCIGVGIGPGNFTGIRIAVSAARGLALSLGIQAIGVSTLEAQALDIEGVVISTLDARQDKIYVQVFPAKEGQYDPLLCNYEFLPTLPKGVMPTCVGFDSETISSIYNGYQENSVHPIAVAIARIAAARMGSTQPRPAPLYLRPADAAPPRDPAPKIL